MDIKKKKVGNACRTRNQIRGSKSRGAQGEYSVADSLRPIYPDILVTKQLGFVEQYDLISKENKIAIECKFHKKLSWNECVKIFKKLEKNSPTDYTNYLIYKTNFQPVLVMYRTPPEYDTIAVREFKTIFNVDFIKHTGKKK